jgi:hypothetical protein
MIVLWTIAGVISGWILVEFVAAFTKVPMPTAFNFGCSFVGGLIAFTLN